jgi:hypothetical protein
VIIGEREKGKSIGELERAYKEGILLDGRDGLSPVSEGETLERTEAVRKVTVVQVFGRCSGQQITSCEWNIFPGLRM